MALLQVSNIRKQLQGAQLLKGISFTQTVLQRVAITGETGSGKSTLLKIIAGLVQADDGVVVFDGRKVRGPLEKLMPGHKGIGYLSQHYELLNNYTVEALLSHPNLLSPQEAADLYEVCRISHLLQRRTDQLSGGEKQRIALARILITSPKLLLLDEPFSNLDLIHKSILKAVIEDIGNRLHVTCILTSHDPLDTLSWADEMLVMQNGMLIQQGHPKQIYQNPVNEYTAGLTGSYNILSPAQAKNIPALQALDTEGKNICIRPEHFTIATSNAGFAATVENVIFWGSYYELVVLYNGDTLRIKTMERNYKKGDAVKVSVAAEDVWLI